MSPVFPGILVHPYGFYIIDSHFTECTKVSLKSGFFQNKEIRLFDECNCIWKIQDVVSLGGVGLFWGYNIFLNQRLKLQLSFELKEEFSTFEDLRCALRFRFERIKNLSRNEKSGLLEELDNSKDYQELIFRIASFDDDYDFLKQNHPILGSNFKHLPRTLRPDQIRNSEPD